MNFANVMKKEAQTKLTENGAVAYNTLNSGLLDLFAVIGALRPQSESEIEQKFARAFNEDKLLATKMLFYAGNIRGGLGERRTFRVCLKWLAQNYPEIVIKNMANIPLFNRWDSLFILENTPAERAMWEFIKVQIMSDIRAMKKNHPVSLLAKWLPSENTSSKRTVRLARKAMSALYLTPRNYRKTLSALRKYIKVVERDMSANQWGDINYEGVPSYAMKNYQNAFAKHDAIRFSNYIASLNKGEAKINASTLFPYDLVREYVNEVWTGGLYYRNGKLDSVVEAQWKALPNYIEGENNYVVMADVSDSMNGRPLMTSIGLAIYFAERNKGDYHNIYMTFTNEPHFINIKEGATLLENVKTVANTDVGYNTNLEAAFDYILETAIKNNISNEDMPKGLIVISDMEIDRYMRYNNWDFLEIMKHSFNVAGYEMPKIILWNVEARQDTYLSQNPDVIYVSGSSPSVFKSFIGALNGETAYDVMLKTLNDKMYDCVQI